MRHDDEPVEPGIGQTRGALALHARWSDWDPIRGLHQGQRPSAPRQQAGHMAAPDRAAASPISLLRQRGRPHMRPSGWTVSGYWFDRLLGVLVLELYWAQISERGVEPACVVDRIDEARKIGCDVLEAFIGHHAMRRSLGSDGEAIELA